MKRKNSPSDASPLPYLLSFLLAFAVLSLAMYLNDLRTMLHWPGSRGTMEFYFWQVYWKGGLLLLVVLSAACAVLPRLPRQPVGWTWRHTIGCLAAMSVVLSVLILWFSNHQFGAWDESVLADTLWRQSLGQVAYRDFVTSNPPIFVLGAKLAAGLFGASWNAQAYLLCVFSVGALGWCYWMLRRLQVGRAASFLLLVAAAIPGVLVLSIWWYNNTTMMVAGVFSLASVLLLMRPGERSSQASWSIALALLVLCKPNTAGLMIGGTLPVLLVAMRERLRLVEMCGAAAVATWGVLATNRVSPLHVLELYRGIARNRGLNFLGFTFPTTTTETLLLVTTMALPIGWMVYEAAGRKERSTQRWALLALLAVAMLTGFVSIATNGEFAEVSWPPMVFACGLAVFRFGQAGRGLVVFFASFFLATSAVHLYKAETRARIHLIGPFYEEKTERVDAAFYRNLRTGGDMNAALLEIRAALAMNPEKPWYLMPRLEWAYPAVGLAPPTGLPVYWHPGASFATSQTGALMEEWERHHFETLIQWKEDWPYFPPEFVERIRREYQPEPRHYAFISVWHRKQDAPR